MEIAAFTVDRAYLKEGEMMGLPVVAFEEVQNEYPPDEYKMFIAIGYKNLNKVRTQKCLEARSKGYELATYVSSKISSWGDTQVGDNCFILENQVLQPWVKIGNNVVLWSGNHLGHDVVIGDNCWISSHVVVSGNVTIGESSFVGVNATIADHVKIGRECIIGAGALINRDTADRQVYIAKPTEIYRLDSPNFERMIGLSK